MINPDNNCTICRVLEGDKTLGYSTEYRTPTQGLLVVHTGEPQRGEHHVMFVSRDHDNADPDRAMYHRAAWYAVGELAFAPDDGRYTGPNGSEITCVTDTHGHYAVHLYVPTGDMVDTTS